MAFRNRTNVLFNPSGPFQADCQWALSDIDRRLGVAVVQPWPATRPRPGQLGHITAAVGRVRPSADDRRLHGAPSPPSPEPCRHPPPPSRHRSGPTPRPRTPRPVTLPQATTTVPTPIDRQRSRQTEWRSKRWKTNRTALEMSERALCVGAKDSTVQVVSTATA